MTEPTIREIAELLTRHPDILVRGAGAQQIAILDASAPQCLDNPPGCSHRLVPDPAPSEDD